MAAVTLKNVKLREQCMSSQQYVDAGTFLVMEIELAKALVPKRLPEELASRCVKA